MRAQDGSSSWQETGFPAHGGLLACVVVLPRISPVLSLSRLALNSGAGQPHRNDLQLQEWLGWIQRHCGQDADGREFTKAPLLLSTRPLLLSSATSHRCRDAWAPSFTVWFLQCESAASFRCIAVVWTAPLTGGTSRPRETLCPTPAVLMSPHLAEQTPCWTQAKFTRR